MRAGLSALVILVLAVSLVVFARSTGGDDTLYKDAIGGKATEGQLAEMVALLRAGLVAGGLGFSSSMGTAHQDAEGNAVPSR